MPDALQADQVATKITLERQPCGTFVCDTLYSYFQVFHVMFDC